MASLAGKRAASAQSAQQQGGDATQPHKSPPSPEKAVLGSQAEAELSALIERTDYLAWGVDLEYRLIAFNTATDRHMEATFGIRPVLGMHSDDLVSPETRGGSPALYGRALAEGSFQTEFVLADGRTLAMTFNPIVVDGKAIGVSAFGKDATECKAAENALRAAEEEYRDIFEGAVEGMFRASFESLSPSLTTEFGYSSADEIAALVKGSAKDVRVDPHDRERSLRLLENQGVVVGYECRYKRKDGAPTWISLDCRKALAADRGSLVRERFIEDNAERRRTAQAMAEIDARFRSFFSENASVMLLVDPCHRTIFTANQAATKFYGYDLEQLMGMSINCINMMPSEEVARENSRAHERQLHGARHTTETLRGLP